MFALTNGLGFIAVCVLQLLVMVPQLASAAELRALIRDQNGKAVENAVVLAAPIDQRLVESPKPVRIIVDQINKEFVPFVEPVYVGSLVHFPNKDNVRHHVYSFSPTKKFELPLYAGTESPPVLFDKPGVVVLGCNIHDWMLAYIYVAETPYFARSGSDGVASISNAPAGEYVVRVWHPAMLKSEQETVRRIVMSNDPVSAEWSLALKPLPRIPRPLGGAASGYR